MEHLNPEYLCLFHAITDAIEELERLKADLMAAQRRAEALYVERTDCPCVPFLLRPMAHKAQQGGRGWAYQARRFSSLYALRLACKSRSAKTFLALFRPERSMSRPE